MQNMNSTKIGFYTMGNDNEREFQLAQLLCYALLNNIKSDQIVYYEDDTSEISSLCFLARYPIITTLIIYDSAGSISSTENVIQLFSIIRALHRIKIINLSEM
ncbi:hypothetical protein BSK52_21275 [Paenibacillus odorifer]|uniref:Uncharacterized protein n=1 Tax=Paenibacillus odorifer TaxID=189426 RepID=A0A1R0XRC1_9BACL|nr:hypothetical protein BSK52_21275 [Paenibacillus odorifer]